MCFNQIGHKVYINLNHRKDRKKAFLKEAKRVGLKKVKRVEAVFDLLNGAKGCAASHIKALESVPNGSSVMVLEDDCFFTDKPFKLKEQLDSFFRHFQNNWDVFLLGGNYIEKTCSSNPFFYQIHKSFLTHSYIVNSHYISTLKQCFEKSYQSMSHAFEKLHLNLRVNIDTVWHELQRKDRWYAGKEKVTHQTESFSDIYAELVQKG